MEFEEFQKISRLKRECMISEKIDGTNAQIHIQRVERPEDIYNLAPNAIDANRDLGMVMYAGSRSRYITPTDDNFGFAKWVQAHADELWTLGEGRHYGEWWGSGIQRGYGLTQGEKRFSLFNASRWVDRHFGELTYVGDGSVGAVPSEGQAFAPACCHVVPNLYTGAFSTDATSTQIERLKTSGSVAAPGFMKPEGIVIYLSAARTYFKQTLEKDDEPKGKHAQPSVMV